MRLQTYDFMADPTGICRSEAVYIMPQAFHRFAGAGSDPIADILGTANSGDLPESRSADIHNGRSNGQVVRALASVF